MPNNIDPFESEKLTLKKKVQGFRSDTDIKDFWTNAGMWHIQILAEFGDAQLWPAKCLTEMLEKTLPEISRNSTVTDEIVKEWMDQALVKVQQGNSEGERLKNIARLSQLRGNEKLVIEHLRSVIAKWNMDPGTKPSGGWENAIPVALFILYDKLGSEDLENIWNMRHWTGGFHLGLTRDLVQHPRAPEKLLRNVIAVAGDGPIVLSGLEASVKAEESLDVKSILAGASAERYMRYETELTDHGREAAFKALSDAKPEELLEALKAAGIGVLFRIQPEWFSELLKASSPEVRLEAQFLLGRIREIHKKKEAVARRKLAR